MRVLDIGCGMGLFSITMADMVGPAGIVLAADIQQEMLDSLVRRARRTGLASRIQPVLLADSDGPELDNEPVDFALASWMVHEVPDQTAFFRRISAALRPSAPFLMLEPLVHVSKSRFEAEVSLAQRCGFRLRETRRSRLSRVAILLR